MVCVKTSDVCLHSKTYLSAPVQQTNHTREPKKVSWNDTPAQPLNDDSEHLESETSDLQNNSFTLQDIDEVLGNNSYVSGNTPGVIGAQEVYNDPRQRIQAERMQSSQSRPNPPEKLSFQEKMKMFAMESGQQDSPKSKVKISKAQREIETNFDGTPIIDNNSGTNGSVESMAMISTSSWVKWRRSEDIEKTTNINHLRLRLSAECNERIEDKANKYYVLNLNLNHLCLHFHYILCKIHNYFLIIVYFLINFHL